MPTKTSKNKTAEPRSAPASGIARKPSTKSRKDEIQGGEETSRDHPSPISARTPRALEPPERRVLRRKKQLLSSNLSCTPELLKTLKEKSIIAPSSMDVIQKENSNITRVVKLLDLMPAEESIFFAFCDIIEEDYEQLADELRAEMRAETNQLDIEEYIDREAAILVHREFGGSKRLSQAEKKELHALVALRTQYAKEVWRRQLNKTKNSLKEEQSANNDKDSQVSMLIDKVNKFLRVHKDRMPVRNKDGRRKSVAEHLLEKDPDADGRPLLEFLEEQINLLVEMTTQSLLEKDSLTEEKMRALQLLGITNVNEKLDKHVEEALEKASKQLELSETEAKSKEAQAQSLDDKIKHIRSVNEGQVNQKEKTIASLNSHLRTCHEKVRELQDSVAALRAELKRTQQELATYKQKAEVLETNRRLGYLYGRDKTVEDLKAGRRPAGSGTAAGKTKGSKKP